MHGHQIYHISQYFQYFGEAIVGDNYILKPRWGKHPPIVVLYYLKERYFVIFDLLMKNK